MVSSHYCSTKAVQLILATAAAGGLVACASPAPTPQPSPATITVNHGSLGNTTWTVSLTRSGDQMCFDAQVSPGGEIAGSCGPTTTPVTPIQWAGLSGGTTPGSTEPVIAHGVTRSDIHGVRVDTTSGDSPLTGATSLNDMFNPLGVDAYAFAIALPPGTQVTGFVAFDDNGKEVARQPVATP